MTPRSTSRPTRRSASASFPCSFVPPKGDASQYNADVLMRIVDRRYRDCKPTWLTLNVLDGEEAERRLASPIVDRVRHGSLCLECNWPSYRTPTAT